MMRVTTIPTRANTSAAIKNPIDISDLISDEYDAVTYNTSIVMAAAKMTKMIPIKMNQTTYFVA